MDASLSITREDAAKERYKEIHEWGNKHHDLKGIWKVPQIELWHIFSSRKHHAQHSFKEFPAEKERKYNLLTREEFNEEMSRFYKLNP